REQRVVAEAAHHEVCAELPEELVVVGAAVEGVGPAVREQRVVAARAEQIVVTLSTEEPIRRRSAVDTIKGAHVPPPSELPVPDRLAIARSNAPERGLPPAWL